MSFENHIRTHARGADSIDAYFAHSRPEIGPEYWEPLDAHLKLVAVGGPHTPGAAEMASLFNASEWAALLGWWHDLGKYSPEFQNYLKASGLESANAHVERSGRVDHSTFGAQHAVRSCPDWRGRLLAYCIAGHHAGLADAAAGDASLETRLGKAVPDASPPESILGMPVPQLPPLRGEPTRSGRSFQIAFFTRMIFSCLVDADFLATEWWMRGDEVGDRTGAAISMGSLCARLDRHIESLSEQSGMRPDDRVARARAEVLNACRTASEREPGVFTLTVPTGGGKTFSSMAFALRHAERYGLRRVIYAIPYTSIIEQNAEQFREAFGPLADRAVLEHHSNFEPGEKDEDGNPKEDRWSRLASENWDAPIVVTTTVQLYESLFHNRTSRCRKLHNIAKSVIVLDEAQSIPIRLLTPTLAALRELVRNYGCSIVLCTATQPAVLKRDDFTIGLEARDDHEIIPDVKGLFASLKRTEFDGPVDLTGEQLAAELAARPQVLCIARTKKEARAVFLKLRERLHEDRATPTGDRTCFHLSTDMCPAHRKHELNIIRARLDSRTPCRVVSTPLIEAGVDIDFPIVYRAMAGLDSLAQAAGRCNRNGKSPTPGRVVLYNNLDHPVPDAMHEVRLGVRDTQKVLGRFPDLLAPEAIDAYFGEHYFCRQAEWDLNNVMACFKDEMFNFKAAAESYRLIDDNQSPVVVPWDDEGAALVEQIETLAFPAGRDMCRRCQRFAVGVRSYALNGLIGRGLVAEPPGDLARGLYYLNDPSGEVYDPVLGLDPAASPGPEGLIH